jgi:hypothetical protein
MLKLSEALVGIVLLHLMGIFVLFLIAWIFANHGGVVRGLQWVAGTKSWRHKLPLVVSWIFASTAWVVAIFQGLRLFGVNNLGLAIMLSIFACLATVLIVDKVADHCYFQWEWEQEMGPGNP